MMCRGTGNRGCNARGDKGGSRVWKPRERVEEWKWRCIEHRVVDSSKRTTQPFGVKDHPSVQRTHRCNRRSIGAIGEASVRWRHWCSRRPSSSGLIGVTDSSVHRRPSSKQRTHRCGGLIGAIDASRRHRGWMDAAGEEFGWSCGERHHRMSREHDDVVRMCSSRRVVSYA